MKSLASSWMSEEEKQLRDVAKLVKFSDEIDKNVVIKARNNRTPEEIRDGKKITISIDD